MLDIRSLRRLVSMTYRDVSRRTLIATLPRWCETKADGRSRVSLVECSGQGAAERVLPGLWPFFLPETCDWTGRGIRQTEPGWPVERPLQDCANCCNYYSRGVVGGGEGRVVLLERWCGGGGGGGLVLDRR